MPRWFAIVLLSLLTIACASPTPTPTPSPSPAADLPTLALEANISGIPGGNEPVATVQSHTPTGSVPIGVQQSFTLGHCGLGSPIDLDGALWDPVAGDDGSGGPLTEDQIGELINSTAVVLVLIDHETALFATPLGARILLTRHDGPRAYLLCA